MARILVAEDSPTQAAEIRYLLVGAGYEVQLVPDGRAALAAIEASPPDLVLTDLDMPQMDGLQLVEAMRSDHPRVPVVLMTAFGNEETAIAALEAGAASYVPKRNLSRDLVSTIRDILSVVEANRQQERLDQYLVEADASFCLENDANVIGPVAAYIQNAIATLLSADDTQRVRLGVAIEEALRSALFHGNLELTSTQLDDAYHLEDGGKSYFQMLEQRRRSPPYCDRRIQVDLRVTRDDAVCTVRDQGAGFAARHLQQLDDTQHLAHDGHRGWLLIKSFMDEVRFDDAGHQITMIKRRNR